MLKTFLNATEAKKRKSERRSMCLAALVPFIMAGLDPATQGHITELFLAVCADRQNERS